MVTSTSRAGSVSCGITLHTIDDRDDIRAGLPLNIHNHGRLSFIHALSNVLASSLIVRHR